MGDGEKLPGPDPSTLRALDYVPKGVTPVPLRVTYTSDSVTDYVNLKKSNEQYRLELGDPLFGVVRKAGKVKDIKEELSKALAAIGVGGLVSHFTSVISEYVNLFLPVPAFPDTIGLSLAVYLLEKMYDANLLSLGYIHQASIDELPNWMGLIEKAKGNPDIRVY